MLAIQLNNPATIRAYFEKVRELHKSGIQFPVDLEDVWPLAFSRKDESVRHLKKDFVENVHYRIFRKSVENSKRGRPQEGYNLTVKCMEFLIATRIPAVFEVYQTVFHFMMDQAESKRELTRKDLALMIIQAEEEKEKLLLENAHLKEVVEVAQPKADFYDAVTQSAEVCDMAKVAKLLNFAGLGRNKLFELLRNEGILRDNNEPYQLFVDKGWFKVIEMKYERKELQRIGFKTVVFQVGIDGIRNLVLKVKRRSQAPPIQSGLFNYPQAQN